MKVLPLLMTSVLAAVLYAKDVTTLEYDNLLPSNETYGRPRLDTGTSNVERRHDRTSVLHAELPSSKARREQALRDILAARRRRVTSGSKRPIETLRDTLRSRLNDNEESNDKEKENDGENDGENDTASSNDKRRKKKRNNESGGDDDEDEDEDEDESTNAFRDTTDLLVAQETSHGLDAETTEGCNVQDNDKNFVASSMTRKERIKNDDDDDDDEQERKGKKNKIRTNLSTSKKSSPVDLGRKGNTVPMSVSLYNHFRPVDSNIPVEDVSQFLYFGQKLQPMELQNASVIDSTNGKGNNGSRSSGRQQQTSKRYATVSTTIPTITSYFSSMIEDVVDDEANVTVEMRVEKSELSGSKNTFGGASFHYDKGESSDTTITNVIPTRYSVASNSTEKKNVDPIVLPSKRSGSFGPRKGKKTDLEFGSEPMSSSLTFKLEMNAEHSEHRPTRMDVRGTREGLVSSRLNLSTDKDSSNVTTAALRIVVAEESERQDDLAREEAPSTVSSISTMLSEQPVSVVPTTAKTTTMATIMTSTMTYRIQRQQRQHQQHRQQYRQQQHAYTYTITNVTRQLRNYTGSNTEERATTPEGVEAGETTRKEIAAVAAGGREEAQRSNGIVEITTGSQQRRQTSQRRFAAQRQHQQQQQHQRQHQQQEQQQQQQQQQEQQEQQWEQQSRQQSASTALPPPSLLFLRAGSDNDGSIEAVRSTTGVSAGTTVEPDAHEATSTVTTLERRRKLVSNQQQQQQGKLDWSSGSRTEETDGVTIRWNGTESMNLDADSAIDRRFLRKSASAVLNQRIGGFDTNNDYQRRLFLSSASTFTNDATTTNTSTNTNTNTSTSTNTSTDTDTNTNTTTTSISISTFAPDKADESIDITSVLNGPNEKLSKREKEQNEEYGVARFKSGVVDDAVVDVDDDLVKKRKRLSLHQREKGHRRNSEVFSNETLDAAIDLEMKTDDGISSIFATMESAIVEFSGRKSNDEKAESGYRESDGDSDIEEEGYFDVQPRKNETMIVVNAKSIEKSSVTEKTIENARTQAGPIFPVTPKIMAETTKASPLEPRSSPSSIEEEPRITLKPNLSLMEPLDSNDRPFGLAVDLDPSEIQKMYRSKSPMRSDESPTITTMTMTTTTTTTTIETTTETATATAMATSTRKQPSSIERSPEVRARNLSNKNKEDDVLPIMHLYNTSDIFNGTGVMDVRTASLLGHDRTSTASMIIDEPRSNHQQQQSGNRTNNRKDDQEDRDTPYRYSTSAPRTQNFVNRTRHRPVSYGGDSDYNKNNVSLLYGPTEYNGTFFEAGLVSIDAPRETVNVSEVISKRHGDGDTIASQETVAVVSYILATLVVFPIAVGVGLILRRLIIKNRKVLEESDTSSEISCRKDALNLENGDFKMSIEKAITKLPRIQHLCHEAEKPLPLPVQESRWEFPRDKLRLQTVLGQGNFGQVWKAEADDLTGHQGTTRLVAVKTVKEGASDREKEDLIRELEIMQQLGSHPNVVMLLGCCTEEEPHYLILEYVMYGKLLAYLRDHRTRQDFYNFSEDSAALTSRDLTVFGYCVARGMEYLASKKIIHRDLAARNILVDHNKLCKIADFGMSRFANEDGEVIETRHGRNALPIRWMAPESLIYSLFTTKTDVWSFGILMWEIVTLGSTPYPDMTAREVMRNVQNGYRLERPSHCRSELFRVISRCWHADPDRRPEFQILRRDLVQLLEDNMNGHYVDLESFASECTD